jgi:N-hydroxyarylamine O-acetyltransferase
MELDAYFERIEFTDQPSVDLNTLINLQRQHLLSIPYENLDVQLGRLSDLDINRIYAKIVEQRRGGWCYEMNGILQWALEQIGFDVMRLNGGVLRAERGDDAMGNHLVLCVQLDEPWIVDVGLGDGPIGPYPLKPHAAEQQGFSYQLEQLEDCWRFHNHPASSATSFDFYYRQANEDLFAEKCHWLSTAADSPFVKTLVCQRAVPGGYDVQTGRVVKRITSAGEQQHLINSAEELVESLMQRFGLDVPEAATLWDYLSEQHEKHFSGNNTDFIPGSPFTS